MIPNEKDFLSVGNNSHVFSIFIRKKADFVSGSDAFYIVG